MKKIFIVLLFIGGLTGTSWARLGETEEQLVTRYGKVVSRLTVTAGQNRIKELLFQKTGFEIHVKLFKGKSGEEDVFKKSSPMTDEDIQALLQAHAQGHAWTELPHADTGVPWPNSEGGTSYVAGGTMWQRDDGVLAMVSPKGFYVKSKELIDAQAAHYQAAHGHSLQGF